MALRDLFFPKKRDFFKMLTDHATKVEEGMQALKEFIANPTDDNGKKVYDLEEEADEVRKHMVAELNESFVTPIDREDIFALARSIDDMVDYAKTTVEEIKLFKIKPNQYMKTISDALLIMSQELLTAITLLKQEPVKACEHVVKAKKTENFIEHRYREGLAELFESTDPIYIIKMREVYRHLSNAADKGDVSADIISNVAVKIT